MYNTVSTQQVLSEQWCPLGGDSDSSPVRQASWMKSRPPSLWLPSCPNKTWPGHKWGTLKVPLSSPVTTGPKGGVLGLEEAEGQEEVGQKGHAGGGLHPPWCEPEHRTPLTSGLTQGGP